VNKTTVQPGAYLFDVLRPDRPVYILDIGANPIDIPPYADILSRGHCHVFGFEPQRDAYDKLVQNKSSNETYYQNAVGDGGTVEFKQYRESGLSSTYDIDYENLEYLGRSKRAVQIIGKATIDTIKLDSLDDLPKVDLLKIDVQGSEVSIISNGANKLRDAICVIAEARFSRLYRNEPMLDELFGQLFSMGFVFHKFLFIKSTMVANSQSDKLRRRRLRNQAIDGDVVLVKDMSKHKQLTGEQLKRLAIASGDIFNSPDLAIRCLDLLVERGVIDENVPSKYVELLPDSIKKGQI
jgi:FkbM family methyltransferase